MVYIWWLFSQNFNGLFGGLIKTLSFFVILFIYSFIHLFIYPKFKEKLIVCLIDMIPVVVLILADAIRDSDYNQIFIAIMVFYLASTMIITLLTQFLQYLWRKFKK